MKSMGLSQLVLVQPESFPRGDAVARAPGVTDVLDVARVVDTLEETLSGCSMVLDTSACDRQTPWPLLDSREHATICLEYLEANGEVALISGHECADLTNEELQHCQFHVHVPPDSEFGLLNLAVVVQVLTHEVRMVWLVVWDKSTKMEKSGFTSMFNVELATADEPEPYYAYLERMLTDTGFLDPEKPRHLMPRLWRLYGYSVISKLKMNILCRVLIETQKAARGLSYKRSDD